MSFRVEGPSANNVVHDAAPIQTVDATESVDHRSRDVFEPQDDVTDTPAAEKPGFFSRLLSAIGSFFAAIWRFITGAEKDDEAAPPPSQSQRVESSPETRRRVATARQYAQERQPEQALRRQENQLRDMRRRVIERENAQAAREQQPDVHHAGVQPDRRVGEGLPEGATVSQKAHHVMDLLRDAGLSPQAAAGIASNIHHESTFREHVWGDSGTAFGLCQWRGDRLANLRAFTGTQTPSLEQQVRFMLHELNTEYPQLVADMNATSDAGDAARMFEQIYERPARHDPERMTTARGYLAAYDNGGPRVA